MITVAQAIEKFKSRLELTPNQQREVSTRHNRLRNVIRGELNVENDFLTGSYARWTKTKPLKDVDVFFVLKEVDKSPSRILQIFRGLLVDVYGAEAVSIQRRSVQVSFGGQVSDDERVLSIDAVPAIASGEHYLIPDSHLGDWIATNPQIHANLATDANKRFDGEWKPLVKMIKKWNEHSGKPVRPSFLIEVMALDLCVPPFSGGYVYELKSFFATVEEQIWNEWPDPAHLGPPVSDQMGSPERSQASEACEQAVRAIDRARSLERQGRGGDALRTWRDRILGNMFPLS